MLPEKPFLDTDLESSKAAVFIPVLSPKGTFGLGSKVWYYITISADKLILCHNSYAPLKSNIKIEDIANNIERTKNGWKYLDNNLAITIFSNNAGIAVITECAGQRKELQQSWKTLLSSNTDIQSILGIDDHRICAKMRKHYESPKQLVNVGGMLTRMIGTWCVRDKNTDFEHTPANSNRNRNILSFLDGKQQKMFYKFECTNLPVIEIVTNKDERTGEVFETFPDNINKLTLLSSKLMLGFN